MWTAFHRKRLCLLMHLPKKEYRLGGAANVALNLKDWAEPIICSVIGEDADGEIFLKLCWE